MGWTCTNAVPRSEELSTMFGQKTAEGYVKPLWDRPGTALMEVAAEHKAASVYCAVCRFRQRPDGQPEDVGPWFVMITLIQREKGNLCWKVLEESMGPAPIELPEKFLAAADRLVPLPELSSEQLERTGELEKLLQTDPDNAEYGSQLFRTDPHRQARAWREGCRTLQERKALLKNLPDGSVIRMQRALQLRSGEYETDFELSQAQGRGVCIAVRSQKLCRIPKLKQYDFEVVHFGPT